MNATDISSIWDTFDFVGVVTFTGYAKSRIPALRQSLSRIGLWDKVHLHWCFPTRYNDKLISCLKTCKAGTRPGAFNATMGHYAVLKSAYELGAKHALVMEDDVRFAEDTGLLATGFQSLPSDYDIAKAEWYFRKCETPASKAKVAPIPGNGRWAPMQGFSFWGDGCTAFSRKGMEWKIRLIERGLRSEFLVCDYFYTPEFIKNDLKAYMSIPVLAQQGVTESTMHAMHKRYEHSYCDGIKYI